MPTKKQPPTGPIDFRPCWPEVLEVIQEATEANFAGSHDPDGNPWEPVTEATLDNRIYSTNPAPLIDTRELLDATNVGTTHPILETENELGVGTPCDHAEIHQQGGTNEAGYKIPQRKFRGWNPEMIAKVKKIVGARAAEALRERGRR
jgi:phage gpG-like protein